MLGSKLGGRLTGGDASGRFWWGTGHEEGEEGGDGDVAVEGAASAQNQPMMRSVTEVEKLEC